MGTEAGVVVFVYLSSASPNFLLLNHIDFFFFWLHWVFIAAHGLSLVAMSGSFLLQWPLFFQSVGSRAQAP